VKARNVDLSEACGIEDAMRRIAIVRFAEVLTLAPALRKDSTAELHDLRIACKRLRHALLRFTIREPSLLEAASRLAQLQDALGEWHDCSLLVEQVPVESRGVRARLRELANDALARARALWRDAFATYGPFADLVRFTGLGYGLGDGEG
jgi:CHAD domain-containing protein